MARGLLDIFMDFSNNEEDFLTVMGIMVRLSEDAAQVQGLSATRRAAQLNSVNKVQHQPREGPSEVSMPGPIPAPDSQGPRLTPPPWGELSAARILASMDIKLQPLLDRYVSMTYLARAQTVNTNIAKHCACSLPGGGAHPRLAELALPERYIQDSGLRHAGKRSLCRGWDRTAN